MIPKGAHRECYELGKCVLREYKGYDACSLSGSCSLADEALRPMQEDRFGPGRIWTMREFDAAEKP